MGPAPHNYNLRNRPDTEMPDQNNSGDTGNSGQNEAKKEINSLRKEAAKTLHGVTGSIEPLRPSTQNFDHWFKILTNHYKLIQLEHSTFYSGPGQCPELLSEYQKVTALQSCLDIAIKTECFTPALQNDPDLLTDFNRAKDTIIQHYSRAHPKFYAVKELGRCVQGGNDIPTYTQQFESIVAQLNIPEPEKCYHYIAGLRPPIDVEVLSAFQQTSSDLTFQKVKHQASLHVRSSSSSSIPTAYTAGRPLRTAKEKLAAGGFYTPAVGTSFMPTTLDGGLRDNPKLSAFLEHNKICKVCRDELSSDAHKARNCGKGGAR